MKKLIWMVLFLLQTGALSANQNPDSSAADSLVPAGDSLRLWNALIYPPMLKLDLFRYRNILNFDSSQPLFELTPQQSGTLFTRPSRFSLNLLPPANQSGNPYLQLRTGFQNSTAFEFDYSEKIRRDDNVKRELGNSAGVFPIIPAAMLALYGAQKAFLALRPAPPLQLDQVDTRLLEILWERPGISAVEVYRQFTNTEEKHPLTFMPLQQRLKKLRRLGLLESRRVENGPQVYLPKMSRKELRKTIEARLREASKGQDKTRYWQLQQMLRLLDE